MQTEGKVSQQYSDTIEVDEGVDIEEGGDASLHNGDATLHPVVELKSLTTALDAVRSQTLAKAALKKGIRPVEIHET
jgi:hypothetical protein